MKRQKKSRHVRRSTPGAQVRSARPVLRSGVARAARTRSARSTSELATAIVNLGISAARSTYAVTQGNAVAAMLTGIVTVAVASAVVEAVAGT
jgi:hypothetical protein